ncbi:MAG: histidine phosphatase family protein [Chloroflexia bacterium]|nr:histidine phosphatase family protein [Chloroflexia bacterium]
MSRERETNLYLIRHGESVPNVEPIIGGMKGDTGLTERGREQARLLEQRLETSGLQADVLYTSTLPRALETSDYVSRALGLSVERDEELQELRPGEADGLSRDEWLGRYHADGSAGADPLDPFGDAAGDPFVPFAPGGESWGSFLLRTGIALNRLVRKHRGQTIVAVCHGGVLEASFFLAFGIGPTGNRVFFDPLNTSITHWRWGSKRPSGLDTWTLVTFNDAGHLDVAGVSGESHEAIPTPVEQE